MHLSQYVIPPGTLQRTAEWRRFNSVLVDYYGRLEVELLGLSGRSDSYIAEFVDRDIRSVSKSKERLAECLRVWELDEYVKQRVKDVRSVYRCKDKFCYNCKVVKQAILMERYRDVLGVYRSKMYHMVLTVPNVRGDELGYTVRRMTTQCGLLMSVLQGKKARGLGLSGYGIVGGLRSLEITFRGNEFHPHLHLCLVVNGEFGEKVHRNRFSKDYFGYREDRLFTEFEVRLQRYWRLLMDGDKCRVRVSDLLDGEGYSVVVDKWQDDDISELFKYLTKCKQGAADDDGQASEFMTYDQFRVLWFALRNVRQLQTYGCLHGLGLDDEDADSELAVEVYEYIRQQLKLVELPVWKAEPLDQLVGYEGSVISLGRYTQHIRSLSEKEKSWLGSQLEQKKR